MVEQRPVSKILAHLILIVGVLVIMFPVWMMMVAATHDAARVAQAPMPIWPGRHGLDNLAYVLADDFPGSPVLSAMLNSLIMALVITIGKIALSLLSAFAIVYFKFRFRMLFFWLMFITLMLPVEVRIVPTYEVMARMDLLNSYVGLTVPLIASAMAVFLFRQTFLTVPDDMLEAARVDGAGPMRFFFDILLPLSRTNIAALFVILFIYGWNQYLWPLVMTTETTMHTIVMNIKNLLDVVQSAPQWHLVMLVSLLAMLPPIVVVIVMQSVFVEGLTETEK